MTTKKTAPDGLNPSKMTDIELDVHNLGVWDERRTRAADLDMWSHPSFAEQGLEPFPIRYRLITDNTMLDLTAYDMMMPTDIPHWSNGKKAEQARKNAKNFHVFEAATSMKPSIVWLGVTNSPPMQVNVMAHAVDGHVALCAINFLFQECEPESAFNRFALWKQKVTKLIRDPRWGWEGVEYILDAANALDRHVGWLPTIQGRPTDDQLREQLEQEVETLRERIKIEGEVSVAEEKVLRKKLQAVQAQLSRHPIARTNDLLGYLADPANTPNMLPEARMLVSIIRERARFLQPVGRTKYMHEGWASYWEKKILTSAHMGIPFAWAFDLAKAWSMHDSTVATSFYFDPYSMGVRVWEYIDRKYGYDEGEVEVVRPRLMGVDGEGNVYEGLELENAFMSKRLALFESETETDTLKYMKRNYDKFFEVARTYEDNRFLNEFLNEELLEHINGEALNWAARFMTRANDLLKRTGWGPQVIFDPLPTSVDDLLAIIQTWLQESQMAEMYHENMGTPMFPLPPLILQHIAQVLMLVKSFDRNKHAVRKQLVMRTGAHFLPNIYIEDDGRDTDGVLTLKHDFDPTWGPLLQSECRDTLKYFRRLLGKPVRLLTMEQASDRQGNPVGDPYPYEYFIEKDTVKERRLS